MSKPSPLVDRRLAIELTALQALLLPCLGLIFYLLFGNIAAKSVMSGVLIGWFGSAYFAWRSFRYAGGRQAKQMLGSFYSGLIGKLVLTALGFMWVFTLLKPNSAVSVFVGFIAVQLAAWCYPIWVNLRTQRP